MMCDLQQVDRLRACASSTPALVQARKDYVRLFQLLSKLDKLDGAAKLTEKARTILLNGLLQMRLGCDRCRAKMDKQAALWRDLAEVRAQLEYEERSGIHTYSFCAVCHKHRARRYACFMCLRKQERALLAQLERRRSRE